MIPRLLLAPLLIALHLFSVFSAEAASITLAGVTFSDELGGVRLLEGSGTGTLGDPFVLIEEITDTGPAILVIRGLAGFGNPTGSPHTAGFALTKIVRNATRKAWPRFSLELREFIPRHSPYEDGLSFGQGSRIGHPFGSDGYARVRDTKEPFDGIQFYEGRIRPGEAATFNFVITDYTPTAFFFLLQKRDDVVAKKILEKPCPIGVLGRSDKGECRVADSGMAMSRAGR
jgi:hypothetical protein